MSKIPCGHSYIDSDDPKNPIPENLIPKGLQFQELFRIEKSEKKNNVRYYVLFKPEEPEKPVDIKVLWYRAAEGYFYRELNWIEQKFAYGVKIESQTESSISFYVTSLNYVHITAQYENGKYIAKTILKGNPCFLSYVYVDVTTVILIKPVIHSVTAKGITESGDEIEEVFIP